MLPHHSLTHFLQMDQTFQHPSIQIYIMGSKPPEGNIENADQGSDQKINKTEISEKGENVGTSNEEKVADSVGLASEDCELLTKSQNENLDDFEVRRCGSMAARLLRDVKIA
jgi:hypothetical protein